MMDQHKKKNGGGQLILGGACPGQCPPIYSSYAATDTGGKGATTILVPLSPAPHRFRLTPWCGKGRGTKGSVSAYIDGIETSVLSIMTSSL